MLDSNAWHTRLYLWTLEAWGETRGTNWRFRSDVTNTCMYIRILFVCLPVLVIFRFLLIFAPLFAVFGPPLMTFGAFGFFSVLVGILIGVGILFGIYMLARLCGPALARFFIAGGQWTQAQIEECKNPTSPGLCRMIIKWIIDAHAHICTVYEIK